MIRFGLLSLLFLLVACAEQRVQPSSEHLNLSPVSFSDLKGWQADQLSEALSAFQHSCSAIGAKAGTASSNGASKINAWQAACASAPLQPANDETIRAYFERTFQPYLASSNEADTGLFTGYYVPELQGSLSQSGPFQTPLYARPQDLISADLGAFKTDLKGQHIVGKVVAGKFIPFDDRSTIAKGSLNGRAEVLAWVDDPVSAFFLEVQGSGRIRLSDGTLLPIGYDGANGHAYVAIGKALADRGELQRPVTMPAIRAWLASHPAQAQDIMNVNPSYVFFRRLPDQNVVGAEGVALTSQRSLAVDPAFVRLGTPLWLDTLDGKGQPIQRLMVAQDTGGAIKGAVRGDFFWGSGEEAATEAGAMQSKGHYYLLLPKSVKPDEYQR